MSAGGGPLAGVRIVEFAAIGPCPFAGMLLADMGATVIRVDRIPAPRRAIDEITSNDTFVDRGRKSVALNLKKHEGREIALQLIADADAVIEGFRPGVMERLGLGPDKCLALNPKLVFGRMTGWGQKGPLTSTAGHDLNYIALSGALHAMGPADRPPSPPLNLVGDYGGGGVYLAMGVLAGLLESGKSGKGQVIDAAMVDGAASLMTMMYSMRQRGQWQDERESNVIDGAAPFYGAYECSDGRFVALGSIEPQFYAEFLRVMKLDLDEWGEQWDTARWRERRSQLAAVFRTRTRDDWCSRFAGTDACVSPVMKMGEAPHHPHLQARRTFVWDEKGRVMPAAAPRFERPATWNSRIPAVGEHTVSVLAEIGIGAERLAELSGGEVLYALADVESAT